MTLNVWGDPVADAFDDDPWTVPEEERRDVDDPTDPTVNALEGGNDLDDWTPEDGPPE